MENNIKTTIESLTSSLTSDELSLIKTYMEDFYTNMFAAPEFLMTVEKKKIFYPLMTLLAIRRWLHTYLPHDSCVERTNNEGNQCEGKEGVDKDG